MALADIIVVGSEFCRQTIPEKFSAKAVVIPYGHDFPVRSTPRIRARVRPRFIFVGSVGPRKGVPQLLNAFLKLEDAADLTVVGPISCPLAALKPYMAKANISFTGGVPRTEVFKYLDDADYFIFPSLFEGGGIVLYEAAAMGLPIIQSKYCGDGCDGTNGEILEEVSETHILLSVRRQICRSDADYQEQSRNSLRIASSRTWNDYKAKVFSLLSSTATQDEKRTMN